MTWQLPGHRMRWWRPVTCYSCDQKVATWPWLPLIGGPWWRPAALAHLKWEAGLAARKLRSWWEFRQDRQRPPPVTGCEMDGVREDEYGGEHYWHCEGPPEVLVDDPQAPLGKMWVCRAHAEMLGVEADDD